MSARTPHKLRAILTTTGTEEQALSIARVLSSFSSSLSFGSRRAATS